MPGHVLRASRWALVAVVAEGCAQTTVQTESVYTGKLPRPERVLVYDFAVAPGEVRVDRGLVAEIQGASLILEGEFLSIDEGNRAERVVIGLGLGRSEVRANVRVVEVTDAGARVLEQFRTAALSSANPGTATEVARYLGDLFVAQGWVTQEAVNAALPPF